METPSFNHGAPARAPSEDVGGDGRSRACAVLARMVREHELPGVQYVVVSARDTLLDVHMGHADVLGSRVMERDTLQMAYSLTKAVTSIAVMQLVERKKLDLDGPLSRYFAAHPYGDAVTVRMLLAHTGGVPNPMPLDWFALEGEAGGRDERLRALLSRSRTASEPGVRHRYSNIGYWLLEKAIEAATGEDYADHVQREIFAPLSVPASSATFELPPRAVCAVGHSRRFTPMNALLWALTPSRYWSTPHDGWSRAARIVPHGRAYGGLFTSGATLAMVLQDLLRDTPRLLSPESRTLMFSPQTLRDGKATSEALGWVMGTLCGIPYLGKQGGGFGFHGNVRLYPGVGLATVLLANRTEISPGPIDARSDELDRAFLASAR